MGSRCSLPHNNVYCSKGHGADSGKTLCRSAESVYAPVRDKTPACHGGGSGGSYGLPRCADTWKAAAPGGACRDGIRQQAGARSRVAPRLCNSVTCYIGSLPSVEAGRLCRAITTSAIPLKTAL
nr:MAG TPA: hypothetical protein [Caudoviricetes sp.]